MASHDLRAGSGPAASQIQAAAAYYDGVMKQWALGNSLFDKFASFVKEQRNEKREDKADAQKDELHALQKDTITKQNALLNKNLQYFDSDKANEKARMKAQNAAAYANAGVNNEQSKALKMQRKEKEDFDALAKRLAPLSYQQSFSNTIDDSTINKALNFTDTQLDPTRF